MDLFKFLLGTEPTILDEGSQINGYTRVTWVERYNSPGEFSLEAKLSSGLTSFLPLGTLISHVDTAEVMIVENLEVQEKYAEDPTITISGRSFTSYLENRIVSMNIARISSTILAYTLPSAHTWEQIVQVINDHIVTPTASLNDSLANVVAVHSVTGTGVQEARAIKPSTVLDCVGELLKIEDLGIQTIRKNTFGISGGSAIQTNINVYRGQDKTSTVMFSWISGEIAEAHYLFSLKDEKNCALIIGKFVQAVVDGSPTKYDRRMMLVDGSDIDGNLSDPPVGVPLANTVAAMQIRGRQALANQNKLSITEIDLSSTVKPQYRIDYNVGDLVSVDGNFGQIAIKRITEYAEVEDENSKTGIPTLSDPGE